jgi:hypothetical protein
MRDTAMSSFHIGPEPPADGPHGNQYAVVEAAILAGTFGPFVTAFCTELGKRFGGTVAHWASRVHLRPKRGDPATGELVVMVDKTVTVLELKEDLPDEARLALLDLDVTTLLGHRLTWSAEVEKWVPADLRG